MPDSNRASSMPAFCHTTAANPRALAGHLAGGLRSGGDRPLPRGPHA